MTSARAWCPDPVTCGPSRGPLAQTAVIVEPASPVSRRRRRGLIPIPGPSERVSESELTDAIGVVIVAGGDASVLRALAVAAPAGVAV